MIRDYGILFCTALLFFSCGLSAAQFSAAISPPRFELKADAGDVLREVVIISNPEFVPSEMLVRTADWSLSGDGGVIIHPETLQPGSCRPWTLIERHRVSLAGQSTLRFRFEVHVPDEATRGECRFAILFQQPPEDAGEITQRGVSLPVLGRIAVIVYVRIGDAAPQLQILEVSTPQDKNNPLPVLVVENTGDAHGRAQGILTLQDTAGTELQASVSTAPILPGEQRSLRLWPASAQEDEAPSLSYPVTVTGTVEWAGGEEDIDAVVNNEPR